MTKSCGSDYVINVKNTANIKDEAIMKMTSDKGIDVVIDCVGAENTTSDSIIILAKGGGSDCCCRFIWKSC